jgi:hypothetical protein
MMCWFCYWGWPLPIAEVFRRAFDAIETLGEDGETRLCYGPAHVVWEDENFDLAEDCIAECDDPDFAEWPPEVLRIVRQSLRELAAVPDEYKRPPAGYDGDRPEDFPPPAGWKMVRPDADD